MAILLNRRLGASKPFRIGQVPGFWHPSSNGLVGLWSFSTGGGTSLYDLTGRHPPGTLFGGVAWRSRGIRLDGVDDYIEISDTPRARIPSTAITVVLGMMSTADPGDESTHFGKMVGYADLSYGFRSQIWNSSNDIQAALQVGGTSTRTPNGGVSLDLNVPYLCFLRWVSGSVINLRVYDRRTGRIFADVNSATAPTGSISYDSRVISMGRKIASDLTGATFTQGEYDIALVAARRWSDAEVAAFVESPYRILQNAPRGLFTASTVAGGVTLAIPRAQITATPRTPGVITTNIVQVPRGQIQVTGRTPTVIATANIVVQVPQGQIAVTGRTPVVAATANVRIVPPKGAVNVQGYAPNVIAGASIVVQVPRAQVSVAPQTPSAFVSDPKVISVPRGQASVQGYAPGVVAPYTVAIPKASSYRDWETDRKSTRLNSSHRL